MQKALTLKSLDRRFDKIDRRFDKMDQRFDKIDRRFGKMDQRFDKMDKRVDLLDWKFDKLEKKVDAMDKKFEGRFDELYKNARVTGERIGTLEERFDDLIAFLKENMLLKSEIGNMATKEDIRLLDERWQDRFERMMATKHGDAVSLIRKTSGGTTELVNTLYDKKMLSADDKVRLIAMQPFPPPQSR